MPQLLIDRPDTGDRDRTEEFSQLARRRAEGELLVPPLMLPKEDRRQHVRQTLREDNQFRIHNRPEGAQAKFDHLTSSLFTFFRGTALLFHRDIAGLDAGYPTVLTIGDIHPENFGVMPNRDGSPFFGIDDFDEACFAPFTWDLRRGAVGFYIAAWQRGWSKKKRLRIVHSYVSGYFDGLVEFARDDREKWHQFRIDNSPPMIRDLLESALESRKEFLAEMVDLEKSRFQPSEEIVPRTSEVEKFQHAVDDYRERSDFGEDDRAGHFRVKDVAIKKGSGTASLGLDRYFVLIDGETDDPGDDIVLEFKQARRSALEGLTPADRETDGDKAARIVDSHDIHLVGGDPYYGRARLDDHDFLVRERSPYKSDIDIDDLDSGGMVEYASLCGRIVSIAHARCDEDTGLMEGNAEETILRSVNPEVLTEDLARFAKAYSKQLKVDFKAFRRDHRLGAFHFVRRDDAG